MSLKLPKEGVSPAFGAAENICLVPDQESAPCTTASHVLISLTRKRFYLLSNYVNASVITSIEL